MIYYKQLMSTMNSKYVMRAKILVNLQLLHLFPFTRNLFRSEYKHCNDKS